MAVTVSNETKISSQAEPKLLAQYSSNKRPTNLAQVAEKSSSPAFIKSAQWTPDGTSIITNSSDKKVRTFIIPPDLLDDQTQPIELSEYSDISFAESVDALTIYPFFDLQNWSAALVLVAANDHPIRLHSAITGQIHASYPLVKQSTEAYIKPTSLLFTPDGTSFLAGSDSQISVFDLSRPGQEPTAALQTGPKKMKASANPGTSLRGIVSALSIDRQFNVLAAGTYARELGLYDAGGQGECLGVFSVKGTEADKDIGGYGVTQVTWSSCGRYLYITERKSNGVIIYDIRKTGQLLGWLIERNALTNQRLNVDLYMDERNQTSCLWAGGVDGYVRSWRNPHFGEGAIKPSEEYQLGTDVINSIGMHHAGGVIASASGQRSFEHARSESDLRLWSL